MSLRSSIAILAISLTLVLITFSWVSRTPLCIDSMLVEKIDRVGANGNFQLYNCALKKHVPYDEKLHELIMTLNPQLQRLESILLQVQGALNVNLKKIEITWLDSNVYKYRVNQDSIFLSQQSSENTELFLRGIVRTSLIQANYRIQESKLLQESLTDLILWSVGLGTEINPENAQWPFVAKSFSTYCKSKLLVSDDVSDCNNQQALGELNKSVQIVPESLRPLLSYILIESMRELEMKNQVKIIPEIFKQLQAQTEQAVPDNLEEILKYFESLSLNSDLLTSYVHHFEKHLVRMGYSQSGLPLNLLGIIVIKDIDDSNFMNLNKELLSKNYAVIKNDQIWVKGSISSIPLKLVSTIKAKESVWISCLPPNFEDIQTVAKQAERMLFIQNCSNASVDLSTYFDEGLDSFAQENKNIKFIKMHLPSLAVAWKKKQTHPVAIIAQGKFDDEFILGLGWKLLEHDAHTNIRKIKKSNIEAIEAFRF